MATGIAQVHVRRSRKKLQVFGMGVSNRGQKYIKASEGIAASDMADPKFKTDLKTAVDKLLA